MKKLHLIIAFNLLSFVLFSQTLYIQTGVSSSFLESRSVFNGFQFYSDKTTDYLAFLGLDYAEKKFLNLSSNIGFIRKGGFHNYIFFDIVRNTSASTKTKAALDYLSLNTFAELKYEFKDIVIPFIGFGPRLDLLLNHSKKLNQITEDINKVSYGINTCGGIKFNLSEIQLGIRAIKYYNINAVAVSDSRTDKVGVELKDNTYSISLSVGVRLR